MTAGPMEGVTLAIGRELDALAGFAQTRTTTPISAGDTIWAVESTTQFQSAGTFVARGTLYTYLSKSPTTLNGIQYTDGVTVFNGAKTALPEQTTVTDFTRARTAMDLLRRALLVDFAETADLDVVGRNLGVLRPLAVGDDTTFRALIKALAYNPKGTVYGIELVLDVLLGASNYRVFEDLINEPNKVFIELLGTAALDEVSAGKSYLTQNDLRPEDSGTQVTLSGPPDIETVYSVQFSNEDNLSDFRNQLPSAETITEYPGDAGTTVWAYVGPAEGSDVTQVPGEHIEIDDSSGADVAQYQHNARTQPSSVIHLSMLQLVTSGATVSAAGTSGNQWGAYVQDDARTVAWGVIQGGAATEYDIGFIDITTGSFISGAAIRLTDDVFYDVEIRKFAETHAELYVDGALVEVADYSLFPATTETQFVFGANDSALSGMVGQVKQVGFFARTPDDFWGSRGDSADVNDGGNDKRVDVNVASSFISGDVGKRFQIFGGTTTNPSGGTNNGIFEVDGFVDSQRLDLKGPDRAGGFVDTGNPTRFNANDATTFLYPDDLGKEVVITGAANAANNGTFVISQLLSEQDQSDLDALLTQTPERTGIAVLTGATFVTETGLDYRVDPVFVTEAGLDWELSDTGSEAAGVITTRQTMPALSGAQTRILEIRYTDVLSAQVLEASVLRNALLSSPPPVYEVYPFYISDPLGFIRQILDDLTVAGVIPEILEE